MVLGGLEELVVVSASGVVVLVALVLDELLGGGLLGTSMEAKSLSSVKLSASSGPRNGGRR